MELFSVEITSFASGPSIAVAFSILKTLTSPMKRRPLDIQYILQMRVLQWVSNPLWSLIHLCAFSGVTKIRQTSKNNFCFNAPKIPSQLQLLMFIRLQGNLGCILLPSRQNMIIFSISRWIWSLAGNFNNKRQV